MFLVGDAPPHMDYAQDTKYPEVLALAKQKDIIVNAVQAGGARDTERVWREIAQMGNGRYIPIPQDGGQIVIIETPYDIEIIELQGRINGTVIPYGPKSRRSQRRGEDAIRSPPRQSGSERHGELSEQERPQRAGEAITGDGDLVADVAAGRQKLSSVKDDELPDSLRKLEPAQRQAAIDKSMSERKVLNERMAELVKKRDQYVLEQRKNAPQKTADSFDRAVEETLRAQVKR